MFKELLKFATKDESIKWFVLFFSTISLGVAFFFLHTLIQSQVRVSFSFSMINFALFFLVAAAGFITFYLNSELYIRYFFYLLLVHCLINLVGLFVGIYTIEASHHVRNQIQDEVHKFQDDPTKTPLPSLDAWHFALSCCGVSNATEFLAGKHHSDNQRVLPLSCCDELDQNLQCTIEIANQQGCWAAFRTKVRNYRVVAFILIGLSVLLQILLIVAYSRTVVETEK